MPRLHPIPSRLTPSASRTAIVLAAALLAASPAWAQQSRNVTLLSHMDKYSTAGYSSCWSYVHGDGREYAVEFSRSGASIVRLTDPGHPVEVAFFNLPDSEWHEGRQYGDHFYIVTEFVNNTPAGGLTIINMSDPDHPRKVANYTSTIAWAHTIEIDTARGYLYAAGATGTSAVGFARGVMIYSLADPENPTFLTTYGNEFPDYCHTIHVSGTRGYASMQQLKAVHILDLTDPAHPIKLAEIQTPGGLKRNGDPTLFKRTHSSWPSSDGRFLYVSDERSVVGLYVYDIHDLANIQRVYSFEGMPARTIAHDPVVRGNLLFQAYYSAGARVYDISNPAWPVEIAYYDTYPGRDGGFFGCWEVAPLFPSGIFVASDIQTGLYVFRLSGSYGIVRGTVQNGNNGPPLAGAAVSQSPAGPSTVSFLDGRYAIAVPAASSVTLNASLFGFDLLSKSVSVPAGSDRTLDLSLRLSDAGSIRGVVRSAGGSTTLNGAEMRIIGTPLSATSSGGGAYAFSSVPTGSYTVRCIRPGRGPLSLQATVTKGRVTTLDFPLAAALTYFDAESDQGWSLADRTDDATRGLWVRAVPNGTFNRSSGELYQTDQDRTPDNGVACFVTGNFVQTDCPVDRDCNFVDALSDGKTTLTSPVFHFAGVSDPRIGFWRWFQNYVFEIDPGEPLVTQLSGDGGGTWTTVETLYEADPVWNYAEIPVSAYFPAPGDVKIRFIASTRSDLSWEEAAIDDIAGYSGPGTAALASRVTSAAASPTAVIGRPHPSPMRGETRLELTLPRPTHVNAGVYDVQGRLVQTLQDGPMPSGLHTFRWAGNLRGGAQAPAGVYWLKIDAGSVARTSRLVVVH